MNDMTEQFVGYEIALKLKEVGFNENYLTTYDNAKKITIYI
jgi:hypothetical protein